MDQEIEYLGVIDFTSFGYGVVLAYREAYGELREIPVSFRETVYRSDKLVIGKDKEGDKNFRWRGKV